MAMEAAKIGTFDWKVSTGQVYWSPNLEVFMGLPLGGFDGTIEVFRQFVHPEDRMTVQHAVQHSLETGADYEMEFRMLRADGTHRWVQAKGRVFFDDAGKPVRMVGIDIDVTARKKMEEDLMRSRAEARAQAEELGAILDAVPAMTFIAHDPLCQTMTSSRSAYELLRLPPGTNSSKSAPFDKRPEHFQVMKEGRVLASEELPVQVAAATGEAVRNADVRIVFGDGTYRDVFGHAVPLLNEMGKVRGAVGAFVDITERKKAEEELKKSEARLRRFVDANLIGIFSANREQQFLQANDVFLKMLGYSREEFLAKKLRWQEITPPEYLARGAQAVAELEATGVFAPFEKEYFRKDGSRVPILIGAAAITQSPLEWMCFVLDLTERKRLDELRTSERLQRDLLEHEIVAREEERRQIARELHDESGQMLASLLAGLRLIEDAKDLKQAKSGASSLRKITTLAMDELGRLSRGLHPLALDDLGLSAALRSFAEEIPKRFGVKVKLSIVGLGKNRLSKPIEAGLYRIVQEALTNISKHAGAKNAEIRLRAKAPYLDLVISDDGCGFDPEHVVAEGSRDHLGLKGMRERVAMLGGEFTLQSRKGGGTIKSFRVLLQFAARTDLPTHA